MAWNQPDDKPRPPPRGSAGDSSLDDMLRRWQQRVRQLWRPGSSGATAAWGLLLLVLAVWLASGYYQIDASERGVVQRFGAYHQIEQPGHGWHWPWPIETMQKLNVASIQALDSKALMLTADQSLVEIGWSLQYRISDPVQYLFQLRDPQLTLGQSGETLLRELVAQRDMAALLSGVARGPITAAARERIQQMLDGYHAGISVSGVNMTDVQLPDAIVSTQRDAEKAGEDRQRAIADAQAFANDIVPKAQAAAQQQLADAQVYAAQTVANADGEAERFTQLALAYAQAPEVTRSRLYIDTMESILTRSRKIVIDAKNGNGSMIYLPLDKLAEAVRGVGTVATLPAAPAAAGAGGAGPAAATEPPAAAAPASATSAGERPDGGERGRDRGER
ncbi:MAG TPA: FtsH protease activity modulator HflK [Steroidobacteraceae bacterium]|jgi:membrane protease subunit HflK